jgi:hypothetical protein
LSKVLKNVGEYDKVGALQESLKLFETLGRILKIIVKAAII